MHEELIQKIEEAFADVAYPGDNNIGVHSEGQDVFVGQTDWRSLPLEISLRYGFAFLDLKPKAFHFYLPAYMCATLRYPEEQRNPDLIVASLTPKKPDDSYEPLADCAISLFTSAQKSAVVRFLGIYPELYPDDAYALLEDDIAELQRAIQFWKEN